MAEYTIVKQGFRMAYRREVVAGFRAAYVREEHDRLTVWDLPAQFLAGSNQLLPVNDAKNFRSFSTPDRCSAVGPESTGPAS